MRQLFPATHVQKLPILFSSISSPSYVLNLRGLSRHCPVGGEDGLSDKVGSPLGVNDDSLLADGTILGTVEGLVDTLGEEVCCALGDVDGLNVTLGNELGLKEGIRDGKSVAVVGFDDKLGDILGTIDGNEHIGDPGIFSTYPR